MAAYQQTTRNGYNLFEMSSLMQKSIRRGNVKLAAYAAMEMFGSYWAYMWRRLIVISAEDCYGVITKEIVALREADVISNDKRKGYDRDPLFAAKAITLLCMAKKNRDGCYVACNFMLPDRLLTEEEFQRETEYVHIDELELKGGIPEWAYDVHTRQGREKGKTDLDMIISEQAALEPLQLNLFDNADWEQYHDMQKKGGKISPREQAKWVEFQKDKESH